MASNCSGASPTRRSPHIPSAAHTGASLRGELLELYASLNVATDGTLHMESEFLLAVVNR